MGTIKDEHKIIIATTIAFMSLWIIDSAYSAMVMHEGRFVDLLLSVRPNSLFLGIFLPLSFFAIGLVIARILARRGRDEELYKKHSAAIENSMDGIAIFNQDGEFVYVNRAYASINGYAGPKELIGKQYKLAFDEQEIEPMEQIFPALLKKGRWRGELFAKRKNGSTYFQEASMTLLEDGGRVCVIRDITWRKRHEEWLRRSERFLNTIFDSIGDPFCIFDSHFRIIRANKAYAELKNRSVDEMIGRKCHEVLYNNDNVCEGCVVEKSFHSADPCAKDKLVALRDGAEVWMEIFTYPILDEDGKVSHVMEYTRDVTARKKIEDEKHCLIEKLEYLSRTDVLTGLMNRRALTDCLVYEIDRAQRYGSELSLMLCDIDNFREINDTCGHYAGDRALQNVSAILTTVLRKADIAGRYEGEEFMIILPETSVKGAEGLADKLLEAARVTDLRSSNERSVPITMSIGVAYLEPGTDSIGSFIKRADDAKCLSRQRGKDRMSTAKP